ncbi:MAG: phosphatidylglycerophosphatase A [Deltaproteobacteria bacterium]|nr:phosphatidylglycerophosphatase A [Deltaproteobacteria bacterium]
MKNAISKFLATGAYIGYIPFAPGTFGTLWGVLIAYCLAGASTPVYAATVFAVSIVSIYAAEETCRITGKKDPGSIVCDEISGVLVSFFLIPFTLLNAILVFILFRFFDILKPYPAGHLDKNIKGGLGVVADDLAAGVYANISAHIVIWFLV